MRDREKTPSRTIAWAGAAAGAALGACSLLLVVTRGLPQRLGPEIAGILKAEGDFGGVFMRTKDRCQDEGGVLSCRLGVLGRDPTWALVGDSHAIALSRTFHAALEANGASGLALAAGGCPLVDGLRKRPSSPPDDCGEISQRWMEALESPAIRDVMVVGRYPLYLAGERFDNGEGGREEGPGTLMAPKTYSSEEDRRAKAKAGFLKPIQQLLSQGKRVHLIYPIPEAGWSIPRQMVRLALYRQPTTITTSHKRYLERTEEVRGLFDSLGEHPSLFRIRPDQVLCPESAKGRCLTSGPEGPYYADDDHLTQAGADLVLKAELERALRAQE